ncbi:MAG: hypothetical protein D4S02_01170 [Rhodocyclaceae bacterium]|nr:MAG: hypothetical protein D4S02_01170 [Rhodocyclaceae bacterium]
MFLYNNCDAVLKILGARVKAARLQRGDKQSTFAYRIGVSCPTLRDLESGKPSVSMGTFLNALEAVGRLGDITVVMNGVATARQRAKKLRTMHGIIEPAMHSHTAAQHVPHPHALHSHTHHTHASLKRGRRGAAGPAKRLQADISIVA